MGQRLLGRASDQGDARGGGARGERPPAPLAEGPTSSRGTRDGRFAGPQDRRERSDLAARPRGHDNAGSTPQRTRRRLIACYRWIIWRRRRQGVFSDGAFCRANSTTYDPCDGVAFISPHNPCPRSLATVPVILKAIQPLGANMAP